MPPVRCGRSSRRREAVDSEEERETQTATVSERAFWEREAVL
jgi:hypothetical protein